MTFEEFQALVDRTRFKNPIWFELDHDPPADDKMVAVAQAALGASFTSEYVQFLKVFGGGYFAFANVYSVQPDSGWFVVSCNPPWLREHGFLGVSDNGTGDYYGFRFRDGRCEKHVAFYDHDMRAVQDTPFSDLFEYLAAVALKRGT